MMKMMMSEEEKIDYLNSFPPGYRFEPTEEELIEEYLKKKLQNSPLPINQIKDVHLYNHDPWELTENFTSYGGVEYYFFTPTDRKYATGPRAKRVARIGYWKSSGQVIPVYDSNDVEIGSKKVLVFYEGQQPTGNKTPWVMHEYKAKMEDAQGTSINGTAAFVHVRDALAAAAAADNESANGGDKQLDEWVLCKIYKRVEEEEEEEEEVSTPAAQETPDLEETSAAVPAAAENHLNIMEAENTVKYIYPGNDIYFGEDMVYFWRSNKVAGKIFKKAEEEPAAPVEYREVQKYDEVMVNIEDYLVFPEGIDSSESLDP